MVRHIYSLQAEEMAAANVLNVDVLHIVNILKNWRCYYL
jgi:hypothetical protein